MQSAFEESVDEHEVLPNIRAVIEAYRSRQLDWNPGLIITYWSNGVQLWQPRQFDRDELMAINTEHEGHKGIWTEPM